jgi:hypothetical protein
LDGLVLDVTVRPGVLSAQAEDRATGLQFLVVEGQPAP